MKRRGVIAVLSLICAALKGQTVARDNKSYYILDLTPPPPEKDAAGKWWIGTRPEGIEVRLGTRVVRLTAEQIMDALEGK